MENNELKAEFLDIFGEIKDFPLESLTLEDIEVVEEASFEPFVNSIMNAGKSENIKVTIKSKYFILFDQKNLILIDKFGKKIKNLFKLLLQTRNSFIGLNDNELKKLIFICNLVLILAPDFPTIYNIKKELISLLLSKSQIDFEILLGDYQFSHLINKKHRKSIVSWDYRKFILFTILSCSTKFDWSKLSIPMEKFNNFIKKSHNLYKLIFNKDSSYNEYRSFEEIFIACELLNLNEINEFYNRNYYLWNELVFIFKSYSSNKKLADLVFYFSLSIFTQNLLDYSAFSFIFNNLGYQISSFQNKKELKEYLEKIANFNIEISKYINTLITKLL